ncbi:MAG: GNAT family protein [Cyanobacteria bacterium J06634_6]
MFSDRIAFTPSTKDDPEFCVHISDHHQLRLLQLSDAEPLFAQVNANRDYLMQWLSWLPTTQTVDDTRNFIRLTRDRFHSKQGFAAAILYESSLVGVISLNGIDWSNHHSSIGYWLAAPFQQKGIITLSCRAVITYAFNSLKLNRLTILCASQNRRSQAIPQRLGFTHEGTLREAQWLCDHFVDHEVYSLLRREWKS